MGKKENDNQSWFARHKTELIIGGIAVIGLAIGGSCYFLSSGKADVALAGVRNQLSKLTAINNKNLVNAPLANTEASLPTNLSVMQDFSPKGHTHRIVIHFPSDYIYEIYQKVAVLLLKR